MAPATSYQAVGNVHSMGQIIQACQRRRHEAPPPLESVPEVRFSQVYQKSKDGKWRQRLDQCSVLALMHAQCVLQDRARPETPPTILRPDLQTKYVAVSHPPEAKGVYTSMKLVKELHGDQIQKHAMYQRWPSKSEANEYISMFDQHLQTLRVTVMPNMTSYLQPTDTSHEPPAMFLMRKKNIQEECES